MNKKPMQLKPPKSVLDKARTMLKAFNRNTWPEDEWFGINKFWDLNVFEFERKNCATLYRVHHGDTDTRIWYSLYQSDFVYAEQSVLQKVLDNDQREQLAEAAANRSPEAYEKDFERIQNLIDFQGDPL